MSSRCPDGGIGEGRVTVTDYMFLIVFSVNALQVSRGRNMEERVTTLEIMFWVLLSVNVLLLSVTTITI